MKISVVVPVYNVAPSLLAPCLNSLRKQTLRANEYEIVIVDDCSTDAGTLQTLQNDTSDARFRVIRHDQNRGLNEARRTGAKVADGDFVVYVDGDDMLTRDGLELMRMEAHRSGADIVTAWFQRWNISDRSLGDLTILRKEFAGDVKTRLMNVFRCEHSYTMCGRLFRKSLLTDDIFDMPSRIYHEDLITLPRLLRKAERISAVKKTVYYYTHNESSITTNFSAKHAEDFFRAFSQWRELAALLPDSGDYEPAIRQGVEHLTSTALRRCINADNLTDDQKDKTLDYIYSALESFGVREDTATTTVIRAFFDLRKDREFLGSEDVYADLNRVFERQDDARTKPDAEPRKLLSDIAARLKDKIVLIGQVDYQLRNAAAVAKELRKRGHACVVLDNSAFAAGGKRQLRPEERSIFWRTEYIRVPKPPYGVDWLATAKAVIAYNDFNDDFRAALEYRQILGLPAICAVEGINDFERIDFRRRDSDPYRFLSYRRCDSVFLAGENDKRFFEDRDTKIVGLPIIEELSRKAPKFPKRHTAALNVNFTYGVLEDCRDQFIEGAIEAFKSADFDYQITQHPMDKGDMTGRPTTDKTQYALIDACSVFVSRFATGILEALASGKPAIYFNPHGERVDKFTEPRGAFEVATTAQELAAALERVREDIEKNVDFRKRASAFLKEHTNFDPAGRPSVQKFADAVVDVIETSREASREMKRVFFDRLHSDEPFRVKGDNIIFGEFSRAHKAQLNDEEMLSRYFGERGSVMIDVGANFGNSCDVYLGKDWTVHAFEPDPNNRKKLLEGWPENDNLIINSEAVSDKGGQEVSFFASEESTGISGLSAFTKGHREICKVMTTTLRDYYTEEGLTHADFLKVDVEGFDKFVLDGFPWEKDKPEVVLAEFEDAKTVPLGYTVHDLAQLMESKGYSVYVSEWHPIVRYGIAHDWRRFLRYDASLELSDTWGNLIGFKTDPGAQMLEDMVLDTLKFSQPLNLTPKKPDVETKNVAAGAEKPVGSSTTQNVVQDDAGIKPPFYADAANRLRLASPTVFYVLQFLRRTLAGLWRRKTLVAPLALIVVVVLLSSLLPAFDGVRGWLLGSGVALALSFSVFYLGYIVYTSISKLSDQIAVQHAEILRLKTAAKKLKTVSNDYKALQNSHSELKDLVARNNLVVSNRTEAMTDQLDVVLADVAVVLADVADLTEKTRTVSEEIDVIRRTTTALTSRSDDLSKAAKSLSETLEPKLVQIAANTGNIIFLKQRAAASERQIGAMKFDEAPKCLVFFGHHKCGSRFFREEIFARIAEITEAKLVKYAIQEAPFHYSRMDDLDICNIDFSELEADEPSVLTFANASPRSIEVIDNHEKDWRGVRIIRDPRQVLISSYFHHKTDHPTEPNWVWDQLVVDQPILRELPEEDGILYELDHITKQVIEEHILGDFKDERILTIRLEDFALEPNDRLKEMSEFLKLPEITGVNLKRTFAHKESGPWRRHFTSKIRDVFKERYGDVLIELGYEKDLHW